MSGKAGQERSNACEPAQETVAEEGRIRLSKQNWDAFCHLVSSVGLDVLNGFALPLILTTIDSTLAGAPSAFLPSKLAPIAQSHLNLPFSSAH
jgi:hypothetical protein